MAEAPGSVSATVAAAAATLAAYVNVVFDRERLLVDAATGPLGDSAVVLCGAASNAAGLDSALAGTLAAFLSFCLLGVCAAGLAFAAATSAWSLSV